MTLHCMEKDFDGWNEIKKNVDAKPERVFFHPRELWFAHTGLNVGFEQDGSGAESLRPVLIIRKFNNEIFWCIPLTRKWKPRNPYYARFQYAPFPEIKEMSLERQLEFSPRCG
jgi:mRNA interferase MazF